MTSKSDMEKSTNVLFFSDGISSAVKCTCMTSLGLTEVENEETINSSFLKNFTSNISFVCNADLHSDPATLRKLYCTTS